MTTYAVFDTDGFLVALYASELFGLRERPVFGEGVSPNPPIVGYEPNPDCHVPVEAVEITDDQYRELIDNQGLRRWIDGEVVAYEPPGPTPEEQRKAEFPNLEPDQFWFVVRASGHEQEVRDWVASLNDPLSPNYDPVAWAAASAKLDFAKYFERDHPLVEAAREAIGMTVLQLDDLWKYAASSSSSSAT